MSTFEMYAAIEGDLRLIFIGLCWDIFFYRESLVEISMTGRRLSSVECAIAGHLDILANVQSESKQEIPHETDVWLA